MLCASYQWRIQARMGAMLRDGHYDSKLAKLILRSRSRCISIDRIWCIDFNTSFLTPKESNLFRDFALSGTANMLVSKGSLVVLTMFDLLVTVTYASNITLDYRPWLDTSLPTEERLSLLMAQWNRSQIYAQVQGDTVVGCL